MEQTVSERLKELAEPEYRAFTSAILPGCDNILGVRLPHLRKIAKELAKGDFRHYLNTAGNQYYEEIMLQAMVIGYVKTGIEDHLHLVDCFVPKISNWGVCDSFCTGLKFTASNRERVWNFIQPYLDSASEFEIRFGVVMLLNHYIDNTYIDQVITRLDRIRHDGYYVKMAVAWALSMCFVKFTDKTLHYLKYSNLDDVTFNKTIQKIIESRQVGTDMKNAVRQMRRK
jgi:3-methyladenine DNA glycosylase AlkD